MERTVLITGATSGIGREFAKLFAADGYHVVLAARSEEELQIVKQDIEASHSMRASCFARRQAFQPGPLMAVYSALTTN
ncbi:SDR family NAD(P)-dependent oxidoreductase [Paenibacillus soyae]|uniref:SDR family NAD(P)-dependent oxidoreductase n=1 Tax=Paenibacillus soyae TaxID=2969249 RepID=A0A9X2SBN2_9BACL|nr:SDR family NAD(P)-dependent oxidoreductase [Paenibacillus soyae]MCR2805823.1 SDR family NAD(P)-dependent oxidoreductase [Paenibacillus soyae]